MTIKSLLELLQLKDLTKIKIGCRRCCGESLRRHNQEEKQLINKSWQQEASKMNYLHISFHFFCTFVLFLHLFLGLFCFYFLLFLFYILLFLFCICLLFFLLFFCFIDLSIIILFVLKRSTKVAFWEGVFLMSPSKGYLLEDLPNNL